MYDYNRHFSTHDWLAYIPILIIKKNINLTKKWDFLDRNGFWNNDRIKLYLYATAGPDYRNLIHFGKYHDYFPVYAHLMRFNDKGERIKKMNIIDKSPIQRNGDDIRNYTKYGPSKEFMDSADACDNLEKIIIKQLKDSDLNEAVFHMGLMAHYLGDAACFPHVYDFMGDEDFFKSIHLAIKEDYSYEERKCIYEAFQGVHKHFQDMISERTDGKKDYGPSSMGNPFEECRLYDFFHIDFKKGSVMVSCVVHHES